MGLFYKRKETSDEIIIVYKYYPLFWIFLIVIPISSVILDVVIGGKAGDILIDLIWVIVIIFLIDIWKPSQEVRKAMRKGNVQMSGSKFSFSNPLTVRIKKNH